VDSRSLPTAGVSDPPGPTSHQLWLLRTRQTLVRRRRSWCEVGVGEASVTQSILSNPRGTAVTEVVIA